MIDIAFLMSVINPQILIICMVVGFLIKSSVKKIPNKKIPMIVTILGLVLAIGINIPHITLDVICMGLISGLASTGCHQILKSLMKNNQLKK